jgi:hypothetical protein
VSSDEHGNLSFFADPGYYELGSGADPYRFKVAVQPSPNEPNNSAVQSVNGQIGAVVIPSDPAQNVAGLRTLGSGANAGCPRERPPPRW